MHAELRPVLAQQQKLSVELQQGLRLLQMPAEQLLAEVQLWPNDNPFLETFDSSDVPESTFRRETWSEGSDHGGRDEDLHSEQAETETLRGMLLKQIIFVGLSPELEPAVRDLIDEVDEEGFLNPTPADLKRIDSTRSDDVWHRALETLRFCFEPAGIACSSPIGALQEQIRRISLTGTLHLSTAQKLCALLSNNLQTLANITSAIDADRARLAHGAGLTDQELAEVLAVLSKLDPHPGRPWSESAPMVLPECFVEKKGNRWIPVMNPAAMPRIRLSETVQCATNNSTWRTALQEARQLLSRIDMRRETLLRIITFIVERQQGFFERGPDALVPLSQKEIAEALGLAESTISRAMTGKYLQCRAGTFEWRRLLPASAVEGCSADNLRSAIVRLITNEDPAKPLSDAAIETLLAKEGVSVARRTIAKYREAEGIPSTRERRRK